MSVCPVRSLEGKVDPDRPCITNITDSWFECGHEVCPQDPHSATVFRGDQSNDEVRDVMVRKEVGTG